MPSYKIRPPVQKKISEIGHKKAGQLLASDPKPSTKKKGGKK